MADSDEMRKFRLQEQELEAHADDPLDTPLTINLQAHVLQRLDNYIRDIGAHTDRALWINTILSTWLYEQGE